MVYLLKSGLHIFPHIFVWGSCFWFCIPPPPPPPPHNFVTHNLVTHTHHFSTQTFTHNFVTHTTYNFVTNSLSHTTLSHTIFQHKRPVFCVAGAALLALGWIWWRAWSPLVARDAAALCLAGVALGDIHRRFAWQAWQLATSTVPSFPWQAWHLWRWAGSGGALGPRWSPVTPRHFAWQAWHLATSTVVLRGRHGTWRHPPSLCMAGQHLVQSTFVSVAGVALRDIHAASESISLKYDFVTHNKLCHTHSFVAHTTFHTQLCHPQLCHTHTILSYTTLSHTHTTLSHTIFRTQLCHTQSFTHNFVTHTILHTQLCHHTIVHTQLCHIQLFHTELFRYNFQNCRSSTISFVLVAFSAPLQPLFLLGGRSWHVGLSGPFIFEWPGMAYQLSLLMIRGKIIAANHRSMGVKMGPWA